MIKLIRSSFIVRRVLPKSTIFADCTRPVSCCIFVSVSEGDAFVSRRAFVSGVSDATEGRDDATMRGEGPAKKSKRKSNRKTKDLQASAELRRHTRRLAARQILQLSCTAAERPLSVAQNIPHLSQTTHCKNRISLLEKARVTGVSHSHSQV